MLARLLMIIVGFGLYTGGWTVVTASAQDASKDPSAASAEKDERFARLAEILSGAKLSGSFTVTGNDQDKLSREEYHILECRKLDEGDLWMIKTRIKYGQHDVTVPIPIPIQWAGSTPVISLDDFEVPLMGTFDSQVLLDLDKRKYAGTWSHGEVGGHLFGDIVAGEAQSSPESRTPEKAK